MGLQLSTYKPNFDDKRVRAKVRTVLEWALPFVERKMEEYVQMHHDTIRKVFGNTSNNDLAKWLKASILIDAGSGYVAGIRSIQYKINIEKFEQLESVLVQYGTIDPFFRINRLKASFQDELEGKKPFEYNDKAFRLWHRIQYAPSEMRDAIFADFGWSSNFDIEAALPTIFYQLHKRYSGSELQHIKHFIENKRAVRLMIANALDIDYDLAKEIMTALFLGAKLNAFKECAIYDEIRRHFKKLGAALTGEEIQAKLYKLKDVEFVVALQADIKEFWKTTFVAINEERAAAGNEPLEKNLLYFFYERQVIDVIRTWLDSHNIIYFLEHDGFRTKEPVQIDEVKKLVHDKTGLDLNWS